MQEKGENRAYLVGGLFDGERAGDFCGAAAVHDAVVLDEVADHAEGVVEGALGFVDDLIKDLSGCSQSSIPWTKTHHFVTSSHKHRD